MELYPNYIDSSTTNSPGEIKFFNKLKGIKSSKHILFFDENNILTLFDPSASTPGSMDNAYGQEYGPLNNTGWQSNGDTGLVGYHFWNCKFNLPINCNKITVRINSRTSVEDVDNSFNYEIKINDLKNNVNKQYKFRLDDNSETEKLANQLGIPITPSGTHPNDSVLDYIDINFDINPPVTNEYPYDYIYNNNFAKYLLGGINGRFLFGTTTSKPPHAISPIPNIDPVNGAGQTVEFIFLCSHLTSHNDIIINLSTAEYGSSDDAMFDGIQFRTVVN